MSGFETQLSILWPALIAGLLVVLSHVPLGQQVLTRGIVFIDLVQEGDAQFPVVIKLLLLLGGEEAHRHVGDVG